MDGWIDGWMKKMNLFSLFFFCGLGQVSGWQYSSVDLFFAYKVPTSYVFCVFSFALFGRGLLLYLID